MKSLRLLTAALLLCTLPSCSLLGSVLKLPGSLLKTVGRSVGVSGLTDEAPQPVSPESEPAPVSAPIPAPDAPAAPSEQ